MVDTGSPARYASVGSDHLHLSIVAVTDGVTACARAE